MAFGSENSIAPVVIQRIVFIEQEIEILLLLEQSQKQLELSDEVFGAKFTGNVSATAKECILSCCCPVTTF